MNDTRKRRATEGQLIAAIILTVTGGALLGFLLALVIHSGSAFGL